MALYPLGGRGGNLGPHTKTYLQDYFVQFLFMNKNYKYRHNYVYIHIGHVV